jgi:hypothetical protein
MCKDLSMRRLTAKYSRIAGLAEAPSPKRRIIAAVVAGGLAFATTYLFLGVWWGAGTTITWLCGIAGGVAASYAAATTRWGLAACFGVLAALWVLLEAVALLIGGLASAMG